MLMQAAIVVGVAVGLVALLLGGNFVAELAEGRTAGSAWRDTRMLAAAVFGGFFGLVATGFVSLASIFDAAGSLIGSAPVALTNIFSIGLGYLGITGGLELGPEIYLTATFGFLGLALLITEVQSRT